MAKHLSNSKPRVAVYFEGLNTLFRLRESGWEECFDVGHAARRIAGNRPLEGLYYFRARPSMPPIKAQHQYWDEIRHLSRIEKQLRGEFGRYVRYGYMVQRAYGWQEKMTDVWLAVQMMADAWTNVYDVAILVTADTDMVPAVQMLRYFDKRTELVVFPRSQRPRVTQLVQAVSSIRTARRSWFRPYSSRLPHRTLSHEVRQI